MRDIDLHNTAVTDAQINNARQELLREISKESRPIRHGRRRWLGVSALVGGVAATAVAISVLTPTQIDPAAAAVLENAADVTITAIDTTLTPDQYLRIQTDGDQLWQWDEGMGDEAWERFNSSDRADAEAGLIVRETRVLYVPADRSGDWIWDWSADPQVIATYGTRADEAAADWTEQEAASDSGYWPDLQALPGGEIPAAEGDDTQYLLDSYRPVYDQMPRDPQALLDWFRARSGDPNVNDQWVVDALTDVLTANLMPAELRAALLRALALVPGIRVSDVNGTAATLEYQSGDWLYTRTTEITLDTELGMITSLAQTTSNNVIGSDTIPTTVPDTRTSVTTTVVGDAPTP
ncbi:hypothetical protein [Microbacterium invictum]|uniref:CU044_5270 family protein n=1 Tax=Microbacterium invictum TaxID=515415 RepID=A0ABZ0VDX7_9MICO|nr:hypothetical protein [Microbacterium invictum]WQB70876.1 hypothetical protein T9R20_02645 [Microbacterium invictum]